MPFPRFSSLTFSSRNIFFISSVYIQALSQVLGLWCRTKPAWHQDRVPEGEWGRALKHEKCVDRPGSKRQLSTFWTCRWCCLSTWMEWHIPQKETSQKTDILNMSDNFSASFFLSNSNNTSLSKRTYFSLGYLFKHSHVLCEYPIFY